MRVDRGVLLARLHDAFSRVTLEDGVGLLEALEIDSHSAVNKISRAREADESNDWKNLTPDRLKGAFASLAYFDAKGMRFHLPAFLAAELAEAIDEELLWYLCQVDGWAGERFSLLSKDQKHVVCDIMSFLAAQPRYAGQSIMLGEAITKFWSQD